MLQRQRQRVISGPRDIVVHGSDRRVPGYVGMCVLCGREGPLMLSHVAPRWALRWIKEEGSVDGVITSLGVMTRSQDGEKHYLLCGGCEQHLGTAENHLAVLARGVPDEMSAHGMRVEPGAVVHGVDGRLLRRALLGILLKAHFATSQVYASVRLDAPFVESLRRRILRDEYSPSSHPVYAVKWMSCVVPGANPRAMIFPHFKKEAGVVIFDLMMGGWSWTVVFRGITALQRDVELPPRALLGHGPWQVMVGELTVANAVAVRRPPDLGEVGEQGWRSWPRDAECPCGLGARYGDCCADTWGADP